MREILKIENKDTTYHTFSHAIIAYLLLKYSCGIHDIVYTPVSESGYGIGKLVVTSDGMLIFKATVNRDWDRWDTLFQLQYFDGQEYPVSEPKSLDYIKKLIIQSLQKEL